MRDADIPITVTGKTDSVWGRLIYYLLITTEQSDLKANKSTPLPSTVIYLLSQNGSGEWGMGVMVSP